MAMETVQAHMTPTEDVRRTKSATVDVEAFGRAVIRYGLILVLL